MAEKEVKELNEEVKAGKKVEKQTLTGSQIQKALEATEAIAALGGEAEDTAEEKELVLPQIFVVRRRYTSKSDGNKYWEYILPAVFCGSVSEVHFKASDVGGYQALEKLFNDGVTKLELKFHEEKQYDEHTGLRKYMVYEAVYIDDNGFEWRYPLKTNKPSDKAVMENYIRLLRFEAEKSAKASN